MKASRKRLKPVLVSGVVNFDLSSIVSKLVEFPLFDDFFSDLAKFQNLDVFSLFDFPDLDNFPVFNNFSHFSIDSLSFSTLSTSLVTSTSLATSTCDDTVVFYIDISGTAILLKP